MDQSWLWKAEICRHNKINWYDYVMTTIPAFLKDNSMTSKHNINIARYGREPAGGKYFVSKFFHFLTKVFSFPHDFPLRLHNHITRVFPFPQFTKFFFISSNYPPIGWSVSDQPTYGIFTPVCWYRCQSWASDCTFSWKDGAEPGGWWDVNM